MRLSWLSLLLVTSVLLPAAEIEFTRDVAPLLAQHCVKCHGPEKRQGGMRLDTKKFALEGGDLGALWVAGNSAKSKLIELITTDDVDERMPKKAPPLKAEEIALLKKWIDTGATWPDGATIGAGAKKIDLWSLHAPVRAPLPVLKQNDWPRNPIDSFTLAKMEAHGLKPSPEADRTTLIRRLALDITGILPTPEEADAFVKDTAPDAYEKLVDRLLASPHFGERWGRHWLDAARYADTNGFEKDRDRGIWPYRDWVIKSLNADMPFDQFTLEQNAGDLIANATPEQKVATGFHRNTMINEEGGIDVEEFRYEAIVDRVRTTTATWLGLTVACAQCHTHKYDPITHKEYWQFYAFLNNCDEPEFDIPDAAITQRRTDQLKQVALLESLLAGDLGKAKTPMDWRAATPLQATAASGSNLNVLPGGTLLINAPAPGPDKDAYDLVFDVDGRNLTALKLEVLTDPSLPRTGPGRAPNGNFVLSEFSVSAVGADGNAQPLKLVSAESDFAQKDFPAAAAIDTNVATGWAIDDGSGKMNKDRSTTFTLAAGANLPERVKLKVRLEQLYGGQHTLGKFRVSLGYVSVAPQNEAPEQLVARKQREWEAALRPRAKKWTQLAPVKAASRKLATMTTLPDKSVLLSGDLPNNDVYDTEFDIPDKGVTALRLEVLPHESLPDGGPGRGVMFSRGNFLLTELEAKAAPLQKPTELQPIKLQNASQSGSEKQDRAASKAIDGVIDTGWSVGANTGDPAHAIFELKDALNLDGGARLSLTLHQFYIHQQTIGRFRVSITTDPLPVSSTGLPAEIEEILLLPEAQRSTEQAAAIRAHYLSVAPELAEQNKKIRGLRKSLPRYQTSMTLEERAPLHSRKTNIHHRGEFLSPRAQVEPGVPEVLPPMPDGAPKNRLGFARWITDRKNPLTARVQMNRVWYHLLGRGITQTLDDFGVQGEKPNNPELLDWLAVEFMEPTAGLRQGAGANTPWSLKAMIRLIVTSNTYRQSSRVPADVAAKDPANEWLARLPRVRVEAEILRDIGLAASGLLAPKVGGPSIFPPQPDSVSATVYGGYKWNASQGENRYRRGMYVFLKRTAPFGAFQTFDAPTANECVVKRNRTNTPLGALAMLNDEMFMEFARGLAQRVMKEAADPEARVKRAFRLVLTREPDAKELAALTEFYTQQLALFKGGADAKAVAGATPVNFDVQELAAWTMLSRTVLNLDEAVMRE